MSDTRELRVRRSGNSARKKKLKGVFHEYLGNISEGDFSKVAPFVCQVLKKRGAENHYIVRIKEGDETNAYRDFRAVRVPTWKFLFFRYKIFLSIYLFLGVIYLLSYPAYAIVHYLAIGAIIYWYRPFESIQKLMKLQRWVIGYILLVVAYSFYVMFMSGSPFNVFKRLDMIQGLTFGGIMVFVTIPLFALVEKYSSVFALDTLSEKDWRGASHFIWKRGPF